MWIFGTKKWTADAQNCRITACINGNLGHPIRYQTSDWFLLFAKAFLAVGVDFICVLASYRQLAKILFPPLFFPFLCLIFEWIVCSFLGVHDFFVTQPKSAVKKNSIQYI
jgi:hypothetical protein